jgi:hypothetical protein
MQNNTTASADSEISHAVDFKLCEAVRPIQAKLAKIKEAEYFCTLLLANKEFLQNKINIINIAKKINQFIKFSMTATTFTFSFTIIRICVLVATTDRLIYPATYSVEIYFVGIKTLSRRFT